jgi:lipopolysaccharide export system protein LptC
MVAWLKIALPLTALGILSTVFLLARQPDNTGQILPGILDTSLAERTGVTRPSFASVAPNGAAVTLTARRVEQSDASPRAVAATGISAVIERSEMERLTIAAIEAQLDLSDRTAGLSGGVSLETANGYLAQTSTIDLDLENARVVAPGQVGAETPIGSLTAGSLIYEPATDGAHVLVFKDGVKLIYDPDPERELNP